MDKYLTELNEIVACMEELCHLTIVSNGGKTFVQAGIAEVIEHCKRVAKGMTREELKALNANIGRKTVLISYVNARLQYFGKSKLDFSWVPCLPVVAEALLPFTSKKNINEDALVHFDKCVIVLKEVDSWDENVRGSLSYRIFRLFVVMIIFNLLCNAGIMADFMLSQMIIGVDK